MSELPKPCCFPAQLVPGPVALPALVLAWQTARDKHGFCRCLGHRCSVVELGALAAGPAVGVMMGSQRG